MAYGQNAPFGLQPICSINGGSWTEKVNEYEIYASDDGATTYTTPIFTGDPVRWGTSVAGSGALGKMGTIVRWSSTWTTNTPSTWTTLPILGVFMGCEYYSSNISTNNLVQSSYWPGAAQVQPGTKIKAFILDDPNVVYDVQVSVFENADNANAFTALPNFPNINTNGGGNFLLAGSFGSNFALSIGGGTNFNTVNLNGVNAGYANNPATGSRLTGQSAFYLDVSRVAGGADHDYNKNVVTLPLRVIGYTKNPKNVAAPGLTMGTTPFLNVMVTINQPGYAIGSQAPVIVA